VNQKAEIEGLMPLRKEGSRPRRLFQGGKRFPREGGFRVIWVGEKPNEVGGKNEALWASGRR